MGMFDNVIADLNCQKCNSKLDGFQSKNGPQCLNTYHVEEFIQLSGANPHIYTSCENCGRWNEFVLNTTILLDSIKPYKNPYHNKGD